MFFLQVFVFSMTIPLLLNNMSNYLLIQKKLIQKLNKQCMGPEEKPRKRKTEKGEGSFWLDFWEVKTFLAAKTQLDKCTCGSNDYTYSMKKLIFLLFCSCLVPVQYLLYQYTLSAWTLLDICLEMNLSSHPDFILISYGSEQPYS